MDDAEYQSYAKAAQPGRSALRPFACLPKQVMRRHLVENRMARFGVTLPEIRQRRLAPEQQRPRQHDQNQDGQCQSEKWMHVVLLERQVNAPPTGISAHIPPIGPVADVSPFTGVKK